VTVTCHELEVTKDAATSLTRTWTWTILKEGDATELTLSEGQLHTVNYDVTVDASSADSAWAVTEDIAVYNPAPIDATINTMADIVSPDIAAQVVCEVDDEDVVFPYTLPAGETLNCTYSADLPDGADRTNTATAALQNYDYAFSDDEPPVIERRCDLRRRVHPDAGILEDAFHQRTGAVRRHLGPDRGGHGVLHKWEDLLPSAVDRAGWERLLHPGPCLHRG
jgi:hypothetical protein